MKTIFFTLILFFTLSFTHGLNLNKPLEPLKKETRILINYDATIKQDLTYIFFDLYKDKTRSSKFRLKMLNMYLYLGTIK